MYLVDEGGEITLVDASAPGHWKLLEAELAAIGRSFDDIRALVLTYGSDIPRAAESLRRLEGLDARLVLPGHGEPWTNGVSEAARLARERGLAGWRKR